MVSDRDGLYVAVTPAGAISFRYNYSIHGRQETITFGRYGVGGITLAEARERLGEAKKMIAAGKSPAKEKARDKAHVKDAETFGAWSEKWLRGYQMADSTRDMRRSVYERELKPKFGNQKLIEITHEDLRALTDAIVERGAPATAVHAREVVLQVYRWAIERGQKVEKSLAKFGPHDLRRTASTLLHEAGYNTDWIEKCLAHEQRGVRAVYNKAEYREQRTAMLQDWADMIDEWTLTRADHELRCCVGAGRHHRNTGDPALQHAGQGRQDLSPDRQLPGRGAA